MFRCAVHRLGRRGPRGLDRLATGNADAQLIGVDARGLAADLGIADAPHRDAAIIAAINDLELMQCVSAEHRRVKVTQQGHRMARGDDGLRAGWKSLFDRYQPLPEDRPVLAKAIELAIHEEPELAWTEAIEMKAALEECGHARDQGAAIAITQRLQAVGLVHHDANITMGQEGRCAVHPTYIAVVITTQQAETEERALVRDLVDEWETTSVDIKEELRLETDRQKAEFCKDVLALANTRVSGRRFIVVGFNDSTRLFRPGAEMSTAHQMESVLAAYCTPVPAIRLATVAWATGTAGLIEVLSNRVDLPYRLRRDIWKFKADTVFVRHNTLVQEAVGEELAGLVAEGQRARGNAS